MLVTSSKNTKRIGVRMDMTPMVDVAFLLLTFFMLSTTLTEPNAMEIFLPKEERPIQTDVLTLRVRADNALFWNKGTDAPRQVQAGKLGILMDEKLRENPKLTTLIKIDRSASYQSLVEIIDELNLTLGRLGLSEKRFSITTLDPIDLPLLANL